MADVSKMGGEANKLVNQKQLSGELKSSIITLTNSLPESVYKDGLGWSYDTVSKLLPD